MHDASTTAPVRPIRRLRMLALFAGAAFLASPAAADVDRALTESQQQRRADAQHQERVDRLDDEAREALQQYRAAVWETQQLNVYAEQLQSLIDQQADEVSSLEAQLREIEVTEREIMPLMLRMVDALERFIDLDAPFLRDERRDRVASLRRKLGDPATSVADRYQRIVEAYTIESDYGRAIGHERIEIEGRVHDVLRIGRVGLYALSLDGGAALMWDGSAEEWTELPGRYTQPIRLGLRISRETVAPELLLLPMPGANRKDDGGRS